MQRKKTSHKDGSEENINVRAAFIHVIGDLIQSIGVVIAGYIIWFKVKKCGNIFIECSAKSRYILLVSVEFPIIVSRY